MKKYVFSILAMSALVIAACNKELTENDQVVSEEPGVEYEFTASIDEDTPETSASIDFASTGKMTWTRSDKIAVWNASANAFVEFSVKELSNSDQTATFTANVTGTPSFGKAYYPASIAGSSENSVVLPSSYASVAAAAEGFPMMSDTVTPGQPVTFKHLGSFLKLTVNNAPAAATKFTVTTMTSGTYLSGAFSTNFNDGAPTLTATEGNASVTVPKASTVYMPIPAGAYSLRIEVKNDAGFNHFRRDVAGVKTFARATLKKANITVTASTKYYVKTVSHSGYWDTESARMIRTGNNTYALSENCDGNTTYYIFDEYNMDQPTTGYVATGLAKPAYATGASAWGLVGSGFTNATWTPANALPLSYEGDWHFIKNVKFTQTWPCFKLVKDNSWNTQFGAPLTYYGGNTGNNAHIGDLSQDAPYEIANSSPSENIYVEGVTPNTEYDIFLKPSTGQIYIYASADGFDPNGADGVYTFTLDASSGTAGFTRAANVENDPFGDSGFPTTGYSLKGSWNDWASIYTGHTTYSNLSWVIADFNPGSAGTFSFGLCNETSGYWTNLATHTVTTVDLASNLYGTMTYWQNYSNTNATVTLENATYDVYVNVNPSLNGGINLMFEKQ